MGEKVVARDTSVKESDSELAHVSEIEIGGKWLTLVDETCKKAPAEEPAPPE